MQSYKRNGLTISRNNIKLGPVPSVSLLPGAAGSCGHCLRKGQSLGCSGTCYAQKMMRYRKSMADTWRGNWELYRSDSVAYFTTIREFLFRQQDLIDRGKVKENRFRWHVAGDIPSFDYLERVASIARDFPGMRFLAFTKAYGAVVKAKKADIIPTNLRLVISRWPGMSVPAALMDYPMAWFGPKEAIQGYRVADSARPCPGKCTSCTLCWDLGSGESVVFDQH